MRGIILKHSIGLFGFKDGFKFWFKWSFIDPIQMFVWLNITNKPYCVNCGYYCKEGCNYPKLTTRKEKLKHFKEMDKEVNTIEKGKNDLCNYCGEEKGTELIDNPNMDKLTRWLVCKDCKDTLKYQQQLIFATITKNEKLGEEANKKLKEIADRTKKPIMTTTFHKEGERYNISSVEFTGEK